MIPGKDHNPKVSIIIPTYNRAGFILQTIHSIIDQTYSNWELIIVDDGSYDNTEQLIGEIINEKIHFIKCARTGIGGKIKNVGLQKASGEFIAFNDSDDLWDKTKLEKQVHALQNFSEVGFCLTGGYNFKTIDEPIDFFYKQKEGLRVGNIYTSIFQSQVAVFAQALMIRRSCLSIVGNFKEVKSFSDFDFIVSLARNFKAVILYEHLVFRRLHDENYITSNWEKSFYEGRDIIRENKNLLPPAIYKNALFRLYINFGEKNLFYDQTGKALSNFLYAWRQKPFSIIPLKKIAKTMIYFLKGK